jgi:hypothetical protein
MKMKKLALATIFAFMTVSMAPPAVSVATAQGQGQPSPVLSIPISVANFVGTFNLTRFVNVGGVLNAVGTLTGTLTTPAGPVAIARTLSIPLMEPPTATCEILHLELGPLDLNLLGVVVHLDRIVLDIDAQPGPGNLLGNLLCAVAGLLDNPNGLAQILNQILRIVAG